MATLMGVPPAEPTRALGGGVNVVRRRCGSRVF